MALLESCYCCNLLIASVLLGVYVLVAYAIAFAIELWWLLEAEVALPAPAYLLCVGYFCIFLQSAFLLHGLTVKRSFLLMGWLFVMVISSFPEAGLVMFMSLYHWQLDHLYGLTELTCWVIRLVINVTGLVVVQSLYSQWKEEEEVMQRLQSLNMSPMMPQLAGNGHLGNGYINDGFVKSTNRLNGTLRRAPSVISHTHLSEEAQLYGGPLPLPLNNNNNHHHQAYDAAYPPPPPHPAYYPAPLNNAYYPAPLADSLMLGVGASSSEFNASQFDAVNSNAAASAQLIFNNLNMPDRKPDTSKFSRTQSMLDLRSIKKMADLDARNTACVAGAPNAEKLGYVGPRYTQSLDRRVHRKKANSVCGMNVSTNASLERMNVYTDSEGRYVLYTGPSPRDFYRYTNFGGRGAVGMRGAESGRSLAESDDMQRYRDIAL